MSPKLFFIIVFSVQVLLTGAASSDESSSSSRTTRNEPQICQPPPRWTAEGRHVMHEHLGNVSLVALMELQCTFCRNQINSLERLLEYVKQHSLEPTKIIIVAPANESASFVEYYKKGLSVKGITVIQESQKEPVWERLNGCNNDFFIYDTCGRLNFHIPYPQSLTYYHYTVNTLYSVHRHQKCGQCDKNGSGQQNPFLHTDPSLLTPKQIKAWVQSMPPGQRQPSQLYTSAPPSIALTDPSPYDAYTGTVSPDSYGHQTPPGNAFDFHVEESDLAVTTTASLKPPKRQRGKISGLGGRRQNRTRIRGGHKIRHEKNKQQHQQQQLQHVTGRNKQPIRNRHRFTTTTEEVTTTTTTISTPTTTTFKYVEEYDPEMYNEYFDVISPPPGSSITFPSRQLPRTDTAQIPPTLRPGFLTTVGVVTGGRRKQVTVDAHRGRVKIPPPAGRHDKHEHEGMGENGRDDDDDDVEAVTMHAATAESIPEIDEDETETETVLTTPSYSEGYPETAKPGQPVLIATRKPATTTIRTQKISLYNSLLGSAECSTFTDSFCFGLQDEDKPMHACCYKGVYVTNSCTPDKCSSRTYSLCCFQKFQQARYQCCHNESVPSNRPDDFSKCCHDLLIRDDPCCPTSVASSYWSHTTRIAELCLPTIDLSFDGVVLDGETKDKAKLTIDLGKVKSLKYSCPAASKRRDFFYWEPADLDDSSGNNGNFTAENGDEENGDELNESAAFVQYLF